MEDSFASAVVILLLVTDPIGNIPLFVSLLRHVAPKRRVRVIVRECAIALAVLLICVPFGSSLLELFGLSERSLNLAGGVILFLIALRMIFHGPEGIFGDTASGEPFIVPLAIPSIAGPAAIATVILLVSRAPQRLPEWLLGDRGDRRFSDGSGLRRAHQQMGGQRGARRFRAADGTAADRDRGGDVTARDRGFRSRAE